MTWPWEKWRKALPVPHHESRAASKRALTVAQQRAILTQEALDLREAVVIQNHIARDVRRAMEKRK